jgi:hypothetical protein
MPQKKNPHPLGKPGKLKVKIDDRTIDFCNFVSREELALAPKAFSWSHRKRTKWGAMKNIHLHDCTCAAAGHLIQTWSMHTTGEVIIPDSDIVKDYAAVSGYNPETNENDDGALMLDVLKYWRKKGIGGYKIKFFAAVDHKDKTLVYQTMYLFGGLYVGMDLPRSIIGQKVWDVKSKTLKGSSKPGSYGGHAVTMLDYDAEGLTCISWGTKQKMTWDFWQAYAEEAYVTISDEFLNHKNITGVLAIATLEQELKRVTGKNIILSDKQSQKKLLKAFESKAPPPKRFKVLGGKQKAVKKKQL